MSRKQTATAPHIGVTFDQCDNLDRCISDRPLYQKCTSGVDDESGLTDEDYRPHQFQPNSSEK
eukprot:scaffold279193_cov30-Prasinocladus_malaysianus.AAC.1